MRSIGPGPTPHPPTPETGMPTLHPLTALAASILLVVFLIGWCRLHAFFALLVGALAVALMTASGSAVSSVESVLKEMGALTGSIGYSIAVAAVIGAALMESGAADRIVRTFMRVLGEKRAPYALLASGFILGIPVFFDTVFFLLIPLARALSARTGKNYLLHVMAICAGAVVTHATVPPTPGPLAMAEILKLDLGLAILAGTAAGILPALGGLWFARWLNVRRPVPMRAAAGSTLEAVQASAGRDEASLPGFFASVAPVVIPVLLIAAVSIGGSFRESIGDGAWGAIAFFGNKNVALTLGALIAVAVYLKQTRRGWRETELVVGEPLGTAGVIILITAAGGAYGAMIRNSGVGDLLRDWMSHSGASPILLGWALAALLRAAQGSTTVAVITTAGLLTSLGGPEGFGVSSFHLYLAIGYGGLFCSWMNDSGFWLYSRMSGMTEGETLRSWSVLLSVISVIGLAEAWVLSVVFR
jgi:GntP family gluconate:H+ symporter